ncbi:MULTISPECIES: folylpolyglutamate synthase/dihydrofolate synthase family protein [unclassified Parvimonas]|uniref:bifunctional folylpolyglutamate synthase/dihydrofolate synthase n=1 Tax=unclassified Parvimonas TaxID=1151464 RepID=UPI002B46A6DE|nr:MULTISPECIES: folylpolyglutamate synthase/dihydrofolate synthase family protein [unclassified Parvimonas]MEB3089411.1 folylpolyglutamate synthase/dihydrofolate synthase family protein [Parvimonas sp. M20]
MDYETAMIKLRGEVCSGIKLGLQNIKTLMEKLGNPQDKLKIIHIAGTNGKGSCTSFVNSVLVSQGYKVGMFTSPSIYNFEERIRINNKNIPEDKLIELMDEVREVANTLEVFPADFELVTAVAFLYFYREKCDFAIMEVGLGGRLDATNVVDKPLITLITSISFDHQQFLGNTIKEISLEKAGIIKDGVPLVLYSQDTEIMDNIIRVAKSKNSKVIVNDLSKIKILENNKSGQIIDYKEFRNLKINLLGSHQVKNATISLELLLELRKMGFEISNESIYNGFLTVTWPCRFELVSKSPDFILDGAHNIDGIEKFISNINFYYKDSRKIAIFGVLEDKDYNEMLERIIPYFDMFLTVRPDSERAMEAYELKDKIEALTEKKVYSFDNYQDAIDKSFEISSKDDVISAFGSLYFVGEVRKLLGVSDY